MIYSDVFIYSDIYSDIYINSDIYSDIYIDIFSDICWDFSKPGYFVTCATSDPRLVK